MLENRSFLKTIKISLVVILCLLISTSGVVVDASSGKLKGASIINCSGTNYGHHGDGHWHKATKHDAGWYPNGANLGYSNPCGETQAAPKTPVIKESAEAKEKREQAAREAEEKKQAEEAAKEAQRLEKERLDEEARLIAIEEEAERVRIENLRLNDTSVEDVVLGDLSLTSSSGILLIDYKDDISPIIKTNNEKASYTSNITSKRTPFKLNDIVIDVSSENGESTETLTYRFFDLGSKQELLEQDVSITYSLNGKTESINLNYIEEGRVLNFGTLSKTDASNLAIDAININGHVIEFEGINHLVQNGSIPFDQVSNFDFKINDLDYSLPFYISKTSSAPLMLSGVVGVSGLGVFGYLKRKNHK